MSLSEHQKWGAVRKVLAGEWRARQAAAALDLSVRQVRRLVKRARLQGAKGMLHGNRGRPSNRRVAEDLKGRVTELYATTYEDFNLTHFREMLLEREGVPAPCRESIRKILMGAGVWERRRKPPKHRQRRPRREQEGELLQIDASLHRWFGEDEPIVALLGAIDDATGDVPHAEFLEAETTQGYLKLLREIVVRRGIPGALYTDRDSVFVISNEQEREDSYARGQTPLTQFGRALKELRIQWIPASSPQAKGRIERLWGTFQDRLLHELRLEHVRTIREANAYLLRHFLPHYNRRFRRKPARPERAYREAPLYRQREAIFCWKESRQLARDCTFKLGPEVWQVLPATGLVGLPGRRVEVRRTLRGTTEAWLGERRLGIRLAPMQPQLATPRAPVGALASLAAAASSYRKRGRLRLSRRW